FPYTTLFRSRLWLNTFSWSCCTLMTCLTKLDEPFSFLASFLWAFFSLFSVLMRNLGFSNDASFDRTAYLFSPTSMPTARFLSIDCGNACLSTQKIAYHLLPCRLMMSCLMGPSIVRCMLIAISPSLDNRSLPFSEKEAA